MGIQTNRHPLAELRARMGGLSATAYLSRLDQRHRALGYGSMAVRREKVTRWESGISTPELTAQLAMADLHGVPEHAVRELGWPAWLFLALSNDDQVFTDAPWTPEATVAAIQAAAWRESMDRRAFLIVTGTSLTALTHNWAGGIEQGAPRAGVTTRPTDGLLAGLANSLAEIRRLDDVLGGTVLRNLATDVLQLLAVLASETDHDEPTRRRLFTLISEAARLCGWLHFDTGLHAAAQAFYATALRASATADNAEAGANALAFMAIQTYTIGNPHDAVDLVRTALDRTRHRTTPRVRAILHARQARGLSKTPHGQRECARALDHARTELARGAHDDDPDWAYWMTDAELEMLAGSCALDLGQPRHALRHFTTAHEIHYATTRYSRDHTLFLTRVAAAHLALGEIDQACAAARRALHQHTRLHSHRTHTAITDLRAALRPHQHIPVVAELLDLSREPLGLSDIARTTPRPPDRSFRSA